ncbi:hypothetical protein FAM09_20890 [Niastella caeni]|uniref:Peptidase M14 domain-containing protein n=1 Tax=Niastella caeni TaxID=2569763 RepID=A0A4S8HL12_9BACT|nr:M14 family metallopeptidase [Niastella caeni]THU35853.1 hypothetical protein FAM09_20890 [Niastella caeni]
MNKTILAAGFLILSTNLLAQSKPVFQGQGEVRPVETTSRPVQKQWKGNFPFENGAIVFSNNFSGARLNGIMQNNDSTFTVLITPENVPVNPSPWYSFAIWSKRKRTIYINFTYPPGVSHRYYPKISANALNWKPIDSCDYFEKKRPARSDSATADVSIRLSLKPDTLWVSAQELQTVKHTLNWIKEMARKPFISYAEIGKSKEGRPLYVLNIGRRRSKKMIMIISRQHPPEVTGYLAMRSFVETLCNNSPLAKQFRENYSVYVVPLMNPDGVENGHWRHNAGGIDLNRDWTKFNQPECLAVSKFIKKQEKETSGKFYFGIDFHSTYGDIYYTVDPKLRGNMPGLVPEWLTKLKASFPGYDPKIDPNDKMEPAIISRNYFFVSHGMEALVYEVGDNTEREDLKLKGKTGAIELMKLMLSKK